MWLSLLKLAFVGFVVYHVLRTLYRLTFHPLAQFPGPKVAAATKWYEFYYDVCKGEGGQYAWEIQKMHEKYGPIVRINPDEIHINDSSYFNTIYAPLPARRDKWPSAAAMTGSSKGGFSTVDHFIHKRRRAANSHFFSSKAVLDAQPKVQARVGNLCDAIARYCKNGTVLQVHVELLAFTTDLMTNWILGEPLGCQDDPVVAEAWYATSQCLPRITPIVKQFPWIVGLAMQLPMYIVEAVIPDIACLARLRKSMYTAHQKHTERQAEAKPEKDDDNLKALTLFEVLDRSDLPPSEKDMHRQAQEAFVLVAAGTETTARTLTACMFQIVSDPRVYNRLREELVQVMPDPLSEPKTRTLENLPYLTAVLKENLRNMRLITSRLPLQAHDDLEYEGWTIPAMVFLNSNFPDAILKILTAAQSPVSMTPSEVLLDEDIFEDPKAFKPERWLNADGQLHDDFQTHFVPFGRGTRSCQGQAIAWAMMYTGLARLVRRFDFALYETTHARDFEITRDCFLGVPCLASGGIRMMVTHDYGAKEA